MLLFQLLGFPGGSGDKDSFCSAGDLGLIPWSGRSPGEGIGYPCQYSYMEHSRDRGVWQDTVMGLQRGRHNCVNNIICQLYI